MSYRAYLTIRDPEGKHLGSARLQKLVKVEAPGLDRLGGYHVRPYSHTSQPVLLVEAHLASDFRAFMTMTRLAVEACGYSIKAELTSAARRVL